MSLNDIVVYCPFYEVFVDMHSDQIDKVGTFSMFLLNLFFDTEISMEDIISATHLNPSTVNEVIKNLEKSKLIKKSELSDNYTPDELGKEYNKIYKRINDFNEKKDMQGLARAAVNCFSGKLEEIKNPAYFDNHTLPKDAVVFPCNVSKIMLRNHNYSNVKEFMEKRLSDDATGINNKYINYDLTPKRMFYVPYEMSKETYLRSNSDESLFIVSIPVEKVKYSASHVDAGDSEVIAAAVTVLGTHNPEYLSAKGTQQYALYSKIQEINEQCKYMDCYSGRKLEFQPFENEIASNKNVFTIELPKLHKVSDKKIEKNGFNITVESEILYVKNKIPFDALKQI